MDAAQELAAALAFYRAPEAPVPLQGSEFSKNSIQQVSYTHDAMIDLILTNPTIEQNAIAAHFGYTQAWISRILNSDAFLARMAQRKAEVINPTIFATVDEKLRAVASKSLDVVLEKLHQPNATFDQAIEGGNLAMKALGYGARQGNVSVQQNFVVAMPQKSESAAEWAQKYTTPAVEIPAAGASGE